MICISLKTDPESALIGVQALENVRKLTNLKKMSLDYLDRFTLPIDINKLVGALVLLTSLK
jgi:hypothetical protein